ncbi:hypothetical protein D3C84_422500 [compost metagenome]
MLSVTPLPPGEGPGVRETNPRSVLCRVVAQMKSGNAFPTTPDLSWLSGFFRVSAVRQMDLSPTLGQGIVI